MGELRVCRDRGQSEVLGVALLLTIVVGVSLTVVVAGSAAIEQSKSTASVESATMSMAKLDSQISETTANTRGGVSLEDISDDGAQVESGAGKIKIEVMSLDESSREVILEKDLGRVVSEQDDQIVAYQAGGVWRKSAGSDESVVVSPPNFDYRYRNGEPTLSLPLVLIDGDGQGQNLQLKETNREQELPESSEDVSPLDSDRKIRITVQSEFYRAWGEVFERQLSVTPTYSPTSNEVEVELAGKPESPDISGPFISTGTGTLTLNNGVNMDSYDSNEGSYSDQDHEDTTLLAKSDVKVKAGTDTESNIRSDGSVELLDSNVKVGDIYHQDGVDSSGGSYDSKQVVSEDIEVQYPDSMVQNRIDRISETKNPVDPDISRIETSGCGSGPDACVLEEGRYELEKVKLPPGSELILRPNGGTISIAVKNTFEAKANSNIKVEGSGTVHIYNADDFTLFPRGEIRTEDDDATQFWVWQKEGTTAEIKSQAVFTGVLHAGKGELTLPPNNAGDVYGTLIGDLAGSGIGAGRPLHYDRALESADPFNSESSASGDTVSHIQISTKTVEAE